MPGKNSEYIRSAVTMRVSQQPKRMQKNTSVCEAEGITYVRTCGCVFVAKRMCVFVRLHII